MKLNKLIWILAILLVIPISAFAYGTPMMEGGWTLPSSSGASTNDRGLIFVRNYVGVLQGFNISSAHPSTQATARNKVLIVNFTGNTIGKAIANCTIMNSGGDYTNKVTCNNITMAKGTSYCAVPFKDNYNTNSLGHYALTTTFPVFARSINATNDCTHSSGTTWSYAGGENDNIRYIITANLTGGTPPTPTFGLSVIRNYQQPRFINNTNLLTRKLNITYNITRTGTGNETINTELSFLNYTTIKPISDCIIFRNGTCQQRGYTRLTFISNVSRVFKAILDENKIYPGTYNFNDSTTDVLAHTKQNLQGTNSWVSFSLKNLTSKVRYNILEVMFNSTPLSTTPLNVYYCNSTYPFNSNPATASSCVNIYTLPAKYNFHHIHSVNSAHQIIPMTINTTTQKVGNKLKVTSTSYFLFQTPSNTNYWNYYTMAKNADVGSTKTSTNNGIAWTTQTYTIDAHIHQYNGTEIFKYNACSQSNQTNRTCSVFYNQSINLTNLPPTAPQVYKPVLNSTFGKNNLITINWTPSESPTGSAIVNYTLYLFNSSTIKVKPIANLSGTKFGYNWNTTTILTSGQYKFKVIAKDANGMNSTGTSQLWTYDSLYPRTRADIRIFDEVTQALITENITARIIGTSATYTKYTKTGQVRFDNLTADTYTAQFSGTNFTSRSYFLTIPRTTATLDAWLLRTSLGQQVTITTKDASQNLMSGVTIGVSKFINSSWLTISQKETDVGGTSAYFLQPYNTYRLLLSKVGYNTQLVNLEITQSAYTIYMFQNSSNINFYRGSTGDISYTISPVFGQLAPRPSQPLAFVTNSPSGQIAYFGMRTRFNGISYFSNTSGSPGGGTALLNVNTSTSNRTTLFVQYWVRNSNGAYITLNKSYYLYNVTPGNNSLYNTLTHFAPDINPFYRFLIAIIVSLILGAGFFSLLGATGAMGITLFTYTIFAIGGFVPWQFIIIPAILVVLGYIITGGNEGT